MKTIKKILLLIVVSLLTVVTVKAQETMYIYKDGEVVGEHTLAEVDSVIFYKAEVPEDNTVTDVDGNLYNTVVIGTQTWMAENLKTTKFQNGDIISTTSPAALDISGESEPKYQWAFSGDESNVQDYGRLYTYYTVTDSRNVCPSSWHVPTDSEWSDLIQYLNDKGYTSNIAAPLMANTGWNADCEGTDYFGFKALPAGNRNPDGWFCIPGAYCTLGYTGEWWCSTEYDTEKGRTRYIYAMECNVFRYYSNKKSGLSIRCIKD